MVRQKYPLLIMNRGRRDMRRDQMGAANVRNPIAETVT
jgi:hypothetical protein